MSIDAHTLPAALLADVPLAAVLATYRTDGTILMSPVWFHADEQWVEVVVAEGDAKLERLRSNPSCVFMAFETAPPFRGMRIETEAILSSDDVAEARSRIAARYLGAEDGRRYVEQRTKPGVVVRLSVAKVHSWDLRGILPR